MDHNPKSSVPGVEPGRILIVNIVISSLSALGGLSMILPYLLSGDWRQKTRHKLIVGLGISDISTALAVLIPSIHDLRKKGLLSTGSPECQANGFFYEVTVHTSSLWTVAIAVVTYTLLMKPMSFFATLLKRQWCCPILFALFWFLGCLLAGIGMTRDKMIDYGGLCYYDAQSLYGILSLFLPRTTLAIVTISLYLRLFFFFRHQEIIAVVSDPDSNLDSIIGPDLLIKAQPRRALVKEVVEKAKDAMITSCTPRKGSKDSDITLVDKMAVINQVKGNLQDQVLTPGLSITTASLPCAAAHDPLRMMPSASLPKIGRSCSVLQRSQSDNVESHVDLSSYSMTSLPASLPQRSEASSLTNATRAPYVWGVVHIDSFAPEDISHSSPASPPILLSPTDQLEGWLRSPNQFPKCVTIQHTREASEPAGVHKPDIRHSKRLSGQALNKKASMLMLLYPAAYTALLSLSLARMILEMNRVSLNPHLRLISRWLIMSSGWVDSLIFVFVELHFRRRF